MGQMQQAPVGLREAVSRIAYLTPSGAAAYARAETPSLLRTVAWWRVSRPDDWRALLAAMGAQ